MAELADKKTIAAQLVEAPLFKGVKSADLEAMVQVMKEQTFPKGTILFKKGDPGDSMYVILSGRLRVYSHDEDGHEFTLAYVRPGRAFGEFSMVDEQPRSASALAEEDLTVLVMTRADFLNFLPGHTSLGMVMLRNLTDRVRYITNYLTSVTSFIEHLSHNKYEEAMLEIAQRNTDPEMQGVITAFAKMVSSLQDREKDIQAAQSASKAKISGVFNHLVKTTDENPGAPAKPKSSLFDLDHKSTGS